MALLEALSLHLLHAHRVRLRRVQSALHPFSPPPPPPTTLRHADAMRRRADWNSTVSDAHAALATVSVRTGKEARFEAYLRVVELHLAALWECRSKPCWAREVSA